MRVVVALGGNAILGRGQPMTVDNQRASIARACGPLARIAGSHELIISHGNGPQVGLLALQAAAFDEISSYPFDVLGAQTEGMIGYLIEQELGNRLANQRVIATIVTRTQVRADDPAFTEPSKFVGPVYSESEARGLAATHGWTVRSDGSGCRRVVPSPSPVRIMETEPIGWILDHGGIAICAGGGGIPIVLDPETETMRGVEAVIDKDAASFVLARDLQADLLILATDVRGVVAGWGTADERLIGRAHPDAIEPQDFAPGSMGPKVLAAVEFARSGLGDAVIGSLNDIDAMFAGTAGTRITGSATGIEWARAQ